MTRAGMFRRLALGGASFAAARSLPASPQEIVSVNGSLHLHGDSHLITGCRFYLPERVPAIELHDHALLGLEPDA